MNESCVQFLEYSCYSLQIKPDYPIGQKNSRPCLPSACEKITYNKYFIENVRPIKHKYLQQSSSHQPLLQQPKTPNILSDSLPV